MKQLIRLPQVRDRVGLSRSEIYRRIAMGDFPAPVPLGARVVAWDADEVQEWIRRRISEAAVRRQPVNAT